ncbi:MAG: MBL fold metallo-hydrolase [Hyphomicrobiales bacterium]
MKLNRREILAGGSALGAAAFLGTSPSTFAAATKALGNAEITVLSDGNMAFPASFMFPDIPEKQRSEFLAGHHLSTEQIQPPCNLTLYKTGDRTILFDVGGGSQFLPTTGKLPDSLDEMDLAPDDITDVIFTHAHPDHLWGLLDDFDDLMFPDANYYISQPEWEFWIDPNTVENVREDQQGLAVGTKRRLEALEGQIKLFEPETEVLSGIFAHDTSGHTPGHCSFELKNGSEQLLVLGDALTHPFITFERPEWAFGQDIDTDRAIETRKKLLELIVSDQMNLIGYHLPYPGFGRAERHKTAYRFVSE